MKFYLNCSVEKKRDGILQNLVQSNKGVQALMADDYHGGCMEYMGEWNLVQCT
jgi:hypothetical protein